MEDTGERMSNPDPRVTSAIQARGAKAASAGRPVGDWESRFAASSPSLYSDAEVEVVHNNFIRADGGDLRQRRGCYAAAADEQPPNAGKAQVQCTVG